MIRKTAALAALACCAAAAAASPPAGRVEQGLLPAVTLIGEPTRTMRLEERMAHYRVPAVSIAVIDGGRIAWTRGYGTAGRDTLFQAGSLSKPIAAATALALVRDGRLALDAPVNGALRSWRIPAGGEGDPALVTLRRLLSHSAGLGVHGFRGYAAGEPVPTLRQVLDGAAPANSEAIRIVRAPGSALLYSGGGYTVVQQLIENVTGASFGEAARRLVLRPAGMAHSGFTPPARGRAAPGHRADGSAVEGGWHLYPERAAAGLWSTPGDLARFMMWVMEGRSDAAPQAQRATARALLEPQSDAEGTPLRTPNGNRAGLGLILEGEGAAMRFSHAGSTPGYRAFMIGFPETGQGAVVMVNSDAGADLIKEILRAVAMEYRWPERFHRMVRPVALAPAALEAHAGTWRFESRGQPGRAMEIDVQAEGGTLLVALPDGSNHRLRAISETRFIDPETELTVDFAEPGTLRIPAYGISATRGD